MIPGGIFGGFGSGGAGGGGGGGASLDFFAENGAAKSLYSGNTNPAGLYVSSLDETWLTWNAWTGWRDDPPRVRWNMVCAYNHSTGKYGPIVPALKDPLNDDHHGIPAICRDHEGYAHVFGGAHNTALRYASTDAADDLTAWTERSAIGSDLTYPKPVPVGTGIHLFARSNPGQRPHVLYKTTALSSGVATWGSQISIADPGGTDRFYGGIHLLRGTEIHFVACVSTFADSLRSHVYYLIYDTDTGSVFNHSKGVEVESGDLPVTRTQLDTSFRLVNTGSNGTTVPAFCVDSNGDEHVAYIEGDGGGTYDLKHIFKSSGSWSSPETLYSGLEAAFTDRTLVARPTGEVEAWFNTPQSGSLRVSMTRMVRSAGGTWGSAETILAGTEDNGRNSVAPIFDADGDARIIFSDGDGTDIDSDDETNNKMWVYGDGGFLKRTLADPSSLTTAALSAFATEPNDTRKVQIDRLITDLYETGVWDKLDALYLLAAHDAADALVNLISPGTYDCTLQGSPAPTFTENVGFDTDGSQNFINTNFNPVTAASPNFSRNSAHMSIFSGTAGQINPAPAGWQDGSGNGVRIHPRNSLDQFQGKMNQASNDDASGVTGGNFFHLVNRSGASAVQMYRSGGQRLTSTTASISPIDHTLQLGKFRDSSGFTAFQFRACTIGGSLTQQDVETLSAAMTHYVRAARLG